MHFIDLASQQQRIRGDLEQRIKAILDHGQYILGPEVAELEQRLASFVGVKHCISCASGTDALLMALMAKGVGPGDAVFTSPFTFIATAEVIALLGATPVFVDINPETYNMEPGQLSQAIAGLAAGRKPAPGMPEGLTPRAVIPVDLFGLPADYDEINGIAARHGLFVLEDAAQSFGGMYKGAKACSLAEVTATSFFPAKPLGCYGDGGAVFTDDSALAEILLSIRVHGKGDDKYDNARLGINGRLDTLQAAVLLAKMGLFGEELGLRQEVAARYTERLQGVVRTPRAPEGYRSAWAQYTIETDGRDGLMGALKAEGVPTAVYYPKPLHLQRAFSYLGCGRGAFPVSEAAAGRVVSLPMHPYLGKQEQEAVCAAVVRVLGR